MAIFPKKDLDCLGLAIGNRRSSVYNDEDSVISHVQCTTQSTTVSREGMNYISWWKSRNVFPRSILFPEECALSCLMTNMNKACHTNGSYFQVTPRWTSKFSFRSQLSREYTATAICRSPSFQNLITLSKKDTQWMRCIRCIRCIGCCWLVIKKSCAKIINHSVVTRLPGL